MNVSRSELGELTGFILIGLFILLGFRYVLKAYFKINAKKLDKNSQFYKILVKVMSLNKTLHPYVGYTAILFIALHSFIQTGWNLYLDSETITGIITGLLFVFNVIGGFVGENIFKTKRPKWWIWVHRSLTILIGISILIHINQ
jgi:hypothetical protein